ncbi:alcohol dehydrogenase family protein [Aestuariivirga sp.]|uniref:alcohol dehydrogenase family protein n=1 Tax=Aestuariivirga sp. TaxID=2650926 RepID=UPI00359492A2
MSPDRFDLRNAARSMKAIVTTGIGGAECLVYRDVPVPGPAQHEVLIRVAAAGVNNTEINTRLGWYSPAVTVETSAASDARSGTAKEGGWNGAIPFPFIQGTDCCGHVVESGGEAGQALVGKRVLVRPCMRVHGFGSLDCVWLGSDFDGAFAQYVKVPAAEAFPVESAWQDEELATIPCAYGTAENLIHRTKLKADETVLVTGASGGVGSAAVQLALRRGARVTAIAARDKAEAISALGCETVIGREENLLDVLGERTIDAVIDVVGGEGFPSLLKVLKRGGRYATSGAIAGPVVSLDLRDLYLKDITLIGGTAWDEPVFPNLMVYITRNEIRPLLAKVFPLHDIAVAQEEFLAKRHVGKLVLVPPK